MAITLPPEAMAQNVLKHTASILDECVFVQTLDLGKNGSGIIGCLVVAFIQPSPFQTLHLLLNVGKDARDPVDYF